MTTMIVDDLGRIPMSPYLTATLTRAADYATAQSHREIGLEHLLLALTEDPEATVVLKASHVDLTRLAAEVSEYLGRSDDRIASESPETTAISPDLRRILEAAAAAARQGRRREINGAIVLAAIVGDGTSVAAQFLRVQGLTFEEVIRALQRATLVPQAPSPQPAPAPPSHASPPATSSHPPPAAPPQAPAPAPEPVAAPPPPAPVVPAPPYPSEPAESSDWAEAPPHPHPAPASTPAPQAPPTPAFPGAYAPRDFGQTATTEEILASARERLQHRSDTRDGAGSPSPLPRANYPDLGGPAHPEPAPAPEPAFEETPETWGGEPGPAPASPPSYPPVSEPEPSAHVPHAPPAPQHVPPASQANARWPLPPQAPAHPAPPAQAEARRRGSPSGPFVGSWPLIEAGQLIENIPRRMRALVPVVVEARIARADVKALAEGLQGGGAVFRHEVVVTKAMSVRLRAPEGGFIIENRSPETQWIENVLGLASDDYASWRWTVTPRARGKRQLQLIVSARTVGADGVTAETALPDQVIEVKVQTNYVRTAGRWFGWLVAAVIGGVLAKFGETGFVIAKLLIAKHLGG